MKQPPLGLKKPNKPKPPNRPVILCLSNMFESFSELMVEDVHMGSKLYAYQEAHLDKSLTEASSCQDTGLCDIMLPFKGFLPEATKASGLSFFSIKYLPDVRFAAILIISFVLSPLKILKRTGSISSSLNSTR